jgi:hypothetical protein
VAFMAETLNTNLYEDMFSILDGNKEIAEKYHQKYMDYLDGADVNLRSSSSVQQSFSSMVHQISNKAEDIFNSFKGKK